MQHNRISSIQRQSTHSICESSHALLLTALSMILVTVFVYLYAITNNSAACSRAVIESIREAFPISDTIASSTIKHALLSPIEQAKLDLNLAIQQTGYEIINSKDSIIINGMCGLVFTSDNRISAHALPVLEKIAHIANLYQLNITATSTQDKMLINNKSALFNNSHWDNALQRAGAIYRLFMDLNVPANLVSSVGKTTLGDNTASIELSIQLYMNQPNK